MALPQPKILLLILLGTLIGQSISASGLRPQQQQQQKQSPPVYVIQDEHQLTSSSSEEKPKSWNNQKLTMRSSQAPTRSAKQLYSNDDEPLPHLYHSHKYMGLGVGVGEGSWADKYYQPLQQRYNYAANELPHLAAPTASGGGGQHHQAATKTKQRAAPGATKGGSRKTALSSPGSKRIHHQPPNVNSADANTNSLRPHQNGTLNRAGTTKRKNLVCYYGTWAVYRPDAGRYPVENIDPFLCTHIIYGFTGLSYDNQIKPLDPWNDLEDNYGKGAIKRFTNLKRINPDLKTLVAIGGWNEGSIKYSKMASEPESRARFVSSVVDFLKKYNFDGLDLDWEYPGSRGGHSYDKQNFVYLLRELHAAFQPHGYLLTAAVSAGKWFIEPAYDIGQVSKYLDLINLMAYDYHGGWESKTGMNAPLFSSVQHDSSKPEDALLNVNWSVNYWLQRGAAPEKLMLGVGSYGRSFTLDKPTLNGINAPASQKGQAGPYTREPGSLGYNEICESFQRQPQAWTIVRDPDYLAPYAYNDRQWVGYDDMQSLALKAQFAKSMGLGGMMMWSIETDDFQGRCHNEKYPLLNTLKRTLDAGSSPDGFKPVVTVPPTRPTTTPPVQPTASGGGGSTPRPSTTRRPATATPQASTTPGREIEDEPAAQGSSTTTTSTTRRPPTTSRVVPGSTRKPSTSTTMRPASTGRPTATGNSNNHNNNNNGGEFVCRADGMFADPRNCRKFIRCVSSGGRGYSMFKFDCGPGTAFNEQHQYCDHIYNVPNCSAASSLSSSSNSNNIIMSRYNTGHHQSRTGVVPLAPMLIFG